MEVIRSIFTGIGIVSVAGILALLITRFLEWLCEQIAYMKWERKLRHRFDQPPLAKCYCKDCYNYNIRTTICNYYGIHTPEGMFCGQALPRKQDPSIERKK